MRKIFQFLWKIKNPFGFIMVVIGLLIITTVGFTSNDLKMFGWYVPIVVGFVGAIIACIGIAITSNP